MVNPSPSEVRAGRPRSMVGEVPPLLKLRAAAWTSRSLPIEASRGALTLFTNFLFPPLASKRRALSVIDRLPPTSVSRGKFTSSEPWPSTVSEPVTS
jgi:hypothetical protein